MARVLGLAAKGLGLYEFRLRSERRGLGISWVFPEG